MTALPFTGAHGAQAWPFGDLTPGGYAVIYADPPWRFKNWSAAGEQKNAVHHYRCLTLKELRALPVGRLAAPQCALAMWITSPMASKGFALAEHWGFRFTTKLFAWTKDYGGNRMGLGYYSRSATEDCWLFMRGDPLPRLSKSVRQHLTAPVREHSRKPDEFRDRLAKLFAGPRCELFSRTDHPGFAAWGDQTGMFNDSGLTNSIAAAGADLRSGAGCEH